MIRAVFRVRLLSVVAVAFSAAGAVLMFAVGSVTTVQAIGVYLGSRDEEAFSSGAALEATVDIVSSLDQFLLGLVLLTFAYGVYGLFVVADAESWEGIRARFRPPDWLEVKSVTDLKVNLLKVTAVLLAVLFLKGVLSGPADLEWPDLVVPMAVILLAATIWLIRHSEREGNDRDLLSRSRAAGASRST